MSDSKHTPGPWEVFHRVAGRHHTTAILLTGTKREIIGWNGFDSSSFQEANLANACLIAAAPELLEAAELALKTIDGADSDGWGDDAQIALKAAIRKAKELTR